MITQMEDLLELVADEEYRHALRPQFVDDAVEVLHFTMGQRCRWFIEQKNSRLSEHGPGDHEQLLATCTEVTGERRWGQLDSDVVEEGARRRGQGPTADQPATRPPTQEQVLRHGERVDDTGFLWNDVDSVPVRVIRGVLGHGVPVDQHVPRVGGPRILSVEDLDERRLSRPVLTA